MINLKDIFGSESKRFIGCVDTSFIEGTFLKSIEKGEWKIKIKNELNERLNRLNQSNCLLLINDINVFEIKNKLMKDFGININNLSHTYESTISFLRIVKKIEIKEIKINPSLINWMLRNKLDFVDGLLISIAQRLQLPFITSERKAENWKGAYDGVMSQEDFWRILEKN